MAAVVSIGTMLADRRLWRGPATPGPAAREPTGHAALDAALPGGGWPENALTELLLAADGIGELGLLAPTLARLTRAGRPAVWVDPPYRPYAPALARAGIDLAKLHVVDTGGRETAWAIEQCLRSQACGAVLGWPLRADDRTLRRLQVAAETGQALGFVFRPLAAARNPSPAALRLQLEPGYLHVLKCRGGVAGGRIPFPAAARGQIPFPAAEAARGQIPFPAADTRHGPRDSSRETGSDPGFRSSPETGLRAGFPPGRLPESDATSRAENRI